MRARLEATAPTGLFVLLAALEGEGPLALETRRQVFLAVHRYPGLSLADIARNAGVEEDLVRYHVRVLEKAGLVRSEEGAGERRVFPLERTVAGSASPLSEADRGLIALLRRPPVLRAVVVLLQEGRLTAGALASACGVGASTASHHIRRMEEGGLVRVEAKGRERLVLLGDRDHVLRLLAQHPPPRDLVQGFIETWEGLGL